MVSRKRKSREEIIKAVSGLLAVEQETSMSVGERLTGNLK
jgi:hypothetical protein